MSKYKTDKSLAMLDRVMTMARSGEPITCRDVESALSVGESTAGAYLRHLVVTGMIFRVNAYTRTQQGVVAGQYTITTRAADEELSNFSRSVFVRKTWAPNHVRMEMDCLLFGVPAAMQRVVV